MTTFLLIRHGAHVLGGETIAGRTPGVCLSPLGRDQAAAMAERVARAPVRAIYTSPVERAIETAQVLSERVRVAVNVAPDFAEVDFGAWAGRPIADLRQDERWQWWNRFRSGARTPGGESMLEVQSRVVGLLLRLCEDHAEDSVALVGHADPIRCALAYFMGIAVDLMLRIEVSLASVSVVRVGRGGPWVLSVNSTGEIVLG